MEKLTVFSTKSLLEIPDSLNPFQRVGKYGVNDRLRSNTAHKLAAFYRN